MTSPRAPRRPHRSLNTFVGRRGTEQLEPSAICTQPQAGSRRLQGERVALAACCCSRRPRGRRSRPGSSIPPAAAGLCARAAGSCCESKQTLHRTLPQAAHGLQGAADTLVACSSSAHAPKGGMRTDTSSLSLPAAWVPGKWTRVRAECALYVFMYCIQSRWPLRVGRVYASQTVC